MNEAVLHGLAFQGRPRSFRPEHYMSCGISCRRSLCREVGISNEYYSRLHLQGRISVGHDKNTNRQKYYKALKQALVTLEADLTVPSRSFAVIQSHLDDAAATIRGSRNRLFADGLSIIFCDAVVEYSKMRNSRYAYASWLEKNIYHQRSTEFWLRNLACCLGDIDLLKHYLVSDKTTGKACTLDPQELGELLGMAARRGHGAIFTYLFAEASHDNTGFEFALGGACQSASMHIVQTIFEAVPTASLSDLCLRSLVRLRESQRMPSGYFRIAQLLLDNLNPTLENRRVLSMIMWGQASLNATDQVRYLLDRYDHLIYWPLGRALEPSLSALWSACQNGSVECVQILLNAKYFQSRSRQAGNGDIEDICTQCRPIAMRSNSLVIYEKLTSFMGKSIHIAPFEDLAGMDGSISLMVKRQEIEPKIIETQVKYHSQPQIGQLALVSAATLLRVANVEYLLEKGVRLDEAYLRDFDSGWSGPSAFQIEWRYRRAHESEYQQVQRLLQDYGVRRLDVLL